MLTSCPRCKHGDTYADLLFRQGLGYCNAPEARNYLRKAGRYKQDELNYSGHCAYYEPRPAPWWRRLFGKRREPTDAAR